jgi:flagellar protein FliO/FliZ
MDVAPQSPGKRRLLSIGVQSCPFDGLRALSMSKGCALRGLAVHAAGRSKTAPLQGLRQTAVALAFVFCLLPVSLTAQEKADPVIYPRGSAPEGEGVPTKAPSGGLNSLFLLGTAAAAAGAGWWLWQKRRTAGVNGAAARLAIVESRPLGSRQYLVVADYDGKKFLLGVCPGSIEMLTPLDSQPPGK